MSIKVNLRVYVLVMSDGRHVYDVAADEAQEVHLEGYNGLSYVSYVGPAGEFVAWAEQKHLGWEVHTVYLTFPGLGEKPTVTCYETHSGGPFERPPVERRVPAAVV